MQHQDDHARLTTPVLTFLKQHQIGYNLLPHSAPAFTVADAVKERGVRAETMVKSILLREKAGKRRFVMVCVLGTDRLDLRSIRQQLGEEWKRLTFAEAAEILVVTGFVQGAVAPLAMKRDVPLLFDEKIRNVPVVNISSGDPRAGVELRSADLIACCTPQFADIHDKS